MPFSPNFPLPVKSFEVDRHYNYHIPSDEEIVTIKQKLMKEDKFKEKAKKEGQQKAEEDLDARMKSDIDDMKEKNRLGSEKIPMLEIGEHSAYISKYTYTINTTDQCTAQTADPVNLFFYDHGNQTNVTSALDTAGWSTTSWGDDQCAYASSAFPFYIDGLKKETTQVDKGYGWLGIDWLERDHMRMWDGGYSNGPEGWWSIGAAHHEETSPYEFDHCLVPHAPDGSSFDLAEYHVWNDALGSYPHFFWNAGNAGTFWSCGYPVGNDGKAVGIDFPSDVLWGVLGDGLDPGQHLYSNDLRFEFIYQTDGNLVLYQQGTPIWNTATITSPGHAIMQTDGNFVLYNSSGIPYWATNTWGNSGAYLIVQNDGNVVIYRNWQNLNPIWWSGTCCR